MPASDVVGVVGFWNNGNWSPPSRPASRATTQANHKWYKMGDNGLLSVSRNNVGPWQACHNELSATGIGGNVPLTNLSGVLGLGNNGNSVDTLKTCEQDSEQNN